MDNLKQNQAVVKSIETMIKTRRRIFFIIHPNPKKQQEVINAENNLWRIKKLSDPTFYEQVKHYAENYIAPLIPQQISRYYNKYRKLYQQLTTLEK